MIACIFDTETSGLVENRTLPLDKQPEIIELFANLVDLNSGEVLSELEFLFKPERMIDKDITRITGLTNDDLKDQPPFREKSAMIKEYLEAAPLVIAHNLAFDQDMVEIEFQRLGETINWPARRCTIEATGHLKGYRLNLSRMHEHLFGEPFAGAHRARQDVAALTRCCQRLLEMEIL